MDKIPHPMTPDESVNSGLNAIPSDSNGPDALDPGPANTKDARESGYTDKNGRAIEKARRDVEGEPTNALTDIGEGRSGVVHRH
jgi:hypothetical protein